MRRAFQIEGIPYTKPWNHCLSLRYQSTLQAASGSSERGLDNGRLLNLVTERVYKQVFFFFFFLFILLEFFLFNWSIIALQWCVSFCFTSGSAITIHIFPPPWASHLTPLGQHRAELPLSGRFLISSSFGWFGGHLSCSFTCWVFLCLFILFIVLYLGWPFCILAVCGILFIVEFPCCGWGWTDGLSRFPG